MEHLIRRAFGVTALLAALSLTSCAVYNPQSFWEVSTTKVDLEANNFKVRKLGAQGEATTPFLFGIPAGNSISGVPLGRLDIQRRALEDFHSNWDGQGSVFLHNINVEWTNYGVPLIVVWHQYTITADLYEFDDEYVNYAPRR